VGFVFQHLDGNNSSESDVALSKAMGDYWTNFAKYGTPNAQGSDLAVWPEFTESNPQAMYLTGPKPFVGPVPSENALKVLDQYFTWRRTDEGKEWAK
jgi:para-nitrobenzyl esterase